MDRIVTARSCGELGDAAALILALSLDSGSGMRHAPESEHPDHDTSPKVGDVSPEARVSSPEMPPTSTSSLSSPSTPAAAFIPKPYVAAMVMATAGVLPGFAPGVAIEGARGRGRWVGIVRGAFFPERQARVENGWGGDLWMGSLGGGLGYVAAQRPALTPYALLKLSVVHGEGVGAPSPNSGNTALMALALGVSASYAVSAAWSIAIHGEASLLATTPGFVLDGNIEVHRPERVGLQLGLGVRFHGW